MLTLLNESFNQETLLKIGVALTLSIIMGVEREIKKKPIGLKTSAVIATFSCLLTIISIEAAYLVPARDDINITMDPLRLSAQIVSGIGFLGAGAILRRDNDNITGLTTAAMIWGAAGIGIAVGAGFYIEATFTVISVMIVIELLSPFLSRFGPKRLRAKEANCTIIITQKSKIDDLVLYLREEKMEIDHMRIRQFQTDQHQYRHELNFKLIAQPKKSTTSLYVELTTLPYVESVELVIYP
ncbi:protein sapB [Sporosarcina sp. P37]|uniref:MgtC/SapB family protein n=1 Tax=unclassified Sporosarcina TaxID=2647733 RepID=UPI0009C0BF06|nr:MULTISPECIES: MgtC/SapB family protein [unclassified Sporosarcina]ARD47415.1 protein sapB [Sporosarcina sp. P33]ARK23985.1 protein sapB [Sporosarcina sp. P37]PID17179.1 protein sapB [Sporosarcina sp. P35]